MIRLAKPQDKAAVNAIRQQVCLLHAAARPDTFRQEFSAELANRFDEFLTAPDYEVVVCENGGIVGFAVMKKVCLPQSPYCNERSYLLVEELGVDDGSRRAGIGSQLMQFVKDYAKSNGYSRVQLDVWAFNASAEEFYRSHGFETYRNYMEIFI